MEQKKPLNTNNGQLEDVYDLLFCINGQEVVTTEILTFVHFCSCKQYEELFNLHLFFFCCNLLICLHIVVLLSSPFL